MSFCNNCCKNIEQLWAEPIRQIQVVMIGLNDSGKTSLVHILKNETPMFVAPTFGFSRHSIPFDYKNYELTIYDLGGSKSIRDYWSNYYAEVHGLILVVDCSRKDRMKELKRQFTLLRKNNLLTNKPLLIICNKQDCKSALNWKHIYTQLDMFDKPWNGEYHLIETSAKTTNDMDCYNTLNDGIYWLISTIDSIYDDLQKSINDANEKRNIVSKNLVKLQKTSIESWKRQTNKSSKKTEKEIMYENLPSVTGDTCSDGAITIPKITLLSNLHTTTVLNDNQRLIQSARLPTKYTEASSNNDTIGKKQAIGRLLEQTSSSSKNVESV